jgi:protein involved in polysaccharide export with SLBB domain
MRVTQEMVQTDTLGWQVRQELIDELEEEKIQRIVIDLEAIWRSRQNPSQAQDVQLQAGDVIFIPPKPTGVHVLGSVASAGTIQHTPGMDYHYYIDRCGGFTRNADQKKVRVVKADGRVFERSLKSVKMEAGDTVIVPTEIKRDIDWLVITRDITSILASTVTSVFIITQLGK